MTCNIDARGRWIRGILGMVSILVGLMFWFLIDHLNERSWGMIISLEVVGIFFLFEAWRGWCLLRACGVKTPV